MTRNTLGVSQESNSAAVDTTSVSAEDKARLLMMSHQRNIKHRQQAMLSRVAAEVGL